MDKFLKKHLKNIVLWDELNVINSIKSIKIYSHQVKFIRTELIGCNEKRNLLMYLKKLNQVEYMFLNF